MLDGLAAFFARLPWAFYLTRLVVLVIGLTLHGAAHAGVAALLGDSTPREERRLSLNPNRHLEHVGTLLGLFNGLGFGRPVHIRPYLMRVPPALGGMLVALAGPLLNLILAALGFAAMRGLGFTAPDVPWNAWPAPAEWLTIWVRLNIATALFNLLPLYPLDGYFLIHDTLPLEPMARWEAVAGKTTLILGVGMAALLLMPIPWYLALIKPPVSAIYALLGW